MRTDLRLSLLQLPLHWENPAENIRQFSQWLPEHGTSDLVLLPEMWATGFSMNPNEIAQVESGTALTWMKESAIKTNAVVGGSLAISDGGNNYNRFFTCSPEGEIQRYDKRHLFGYSGEDKQYKAGNDKLIIEIKGWRIFVIICYDLRFPVWCRNTQDYDLMIVVANWPEARIAHWDALLKARAIENQCYVAAVNRIGRDENNLVYPGHSAIYDMNGTQLLFGGSVEARLDATISADKLDEFRMRYPFLADRDKF